MPKLDDLFSRDKYLKPYENEIKRRFVFKRLASVNSEHLCTSIHFLCDPSRPGNPDDICIHVPKYKIKWAIIFSIFFMGAPDTFQI